MQANRPTDRHAGTSPAHNHPVNEGDEVSAFSLTGGYSEVRDFVSDDYVLTITLAVGNVSSAALAGHLYQPDGVEIIGAVVVAAVSATVFTVTIAGQNLAATTYYAPYRWSVEQTNAGSRTVWAFGTLELEDPSTTPPM